VGSLAWPISVLIVLVPAVYVLEWLIGRDIVKKPEKKDIWIRRWRIYLTLFLTGVTIVVDLIVLINTYLNGEITSRFIDKVLIVLVVSAVIFANYILAKNSQLGRAKLWRTIFIWLGVVMVLAVIIAGFAITGSPATQRAMRFDGQRVNDLSNIQYQITNYWQRTGKLPVSLQAMNDPISNFSVPTDPESHVAYEFTTKSINSFELCATFDMVSAAGQNTSPTYAMPASQNDSWNHAAGHVCFERTINPVAYPPIPSKAQ